MSTQEKERRVSCTLCDKSFKFGFSLKRHMAMHGAPKFMCEHCDKLYKTKELLKRHKVVHSGKRPYNCKICNKSFMRQDDVQRHVKTVHKHKADQEIKYVSITSHAPESPTVNVRKAGGETLEMEADLDASVHLVAVNQLQRQGSALEFGELSKISNGIGIQNSSTAVHVDSCLTGDQKEYLEAIFNVNDSVAASECRLITVSIGTGESIAIAEQRCSVDPDPSDPFQIIFQQIMDELTKAGSKTVNDGQL
ncbi:unnamed protein product [Orchesella dallaii]|uniref:C2H2-type domain-containing protein n=1 Tax=Orchesella dallaii TaxID=48710 RepID=A0ABP1S288_9HEXA